MANNLTRASMLHATKIALPTTPSAYYLTTAQQPFIK
ncbi:hypothetical protein [Pseudomonas phage vB_Pa-PAC2]